MKKGEVTTSSVRADYVSQNEPDRKFDNTQNLIIYVTLISLCPVCDLYHNGQVFYKTMKKGNGTASPYADCIIHLKVKIE